MVQILPSITRCLRATMLGRRDDKVMIINEWYWLYDDGDMVELIEKSHPLG